MTAKFMYIFVAVAVLGTAMLPIDSNARAEPESLLVIVAAATGISDITSAMLRRTFEGFPAEYRSGKRFLPLNHPLGSAERSRFDQTVLGLAPDEVGRFWVDQRIRGAAQPPRTLPSGDIAVRVAASFPGAITYTIASRVGAGLRVLTIDGKAPGEPGYFLAK